MVEITHSGAVRLGGDVVCDGFVYGPGTRVQTHVHMDHLVGFESSKGFQDIVASKPTRSLLIAMKNADLKFRPEFKGIEYGHDFRCGSSKVRLLPSAHMLGAAQVQVTLDDGTVLGYSGDFQWPLEHVIQVDTLVVDSTYGSPKRLRRYSQSEVDERFLELAVGLISEGPLIIVAYRGTLLRALDLINGNLKAPIIGSEGTIKEAQIYSEYGFVMPDISNVKSSTGRQHISEGKYIRLIRKGEKRPDSLGNATQITLSAYMCDPADPVRKFGDRVFQVAMTDHADFQGTIDYIQATGAQQIVTDNTRGGHGVELAQEIEARMGIKAMPSDSPSTHAWGC